MTQRNEKNISKHIMAGFLSRKGSNLISLGKYSLPVQDQYLCLPCGMRSPFLWGETTFGVRGICKVVDKIASSPDPLATRSGSRIMVEIKFLTA